jgi:hypothetical protein
MAGREAGKSGQKKYKERDNGTKKYQVGSKKALVSLVTFAPIALILRRTNKKDKG